MMKMLQFSLLINALAILMACSTDPLEKNESYPSLLWRSPLGPSPSDQMSQNPYIYGDKLIMGYQLSTGNEGYFIYDKNSGLILKDIPSQASFDPQSVAYKNNYISFTGLKLRTIDLTNYLIKVDPIKEAFYSPLFFEDSGKIFYENRGRGSQNPNQFQCDVHYVDYNNDRKSNKMLTIDFDEEDGVFGSQLGNISMMKNSKGESILFFGASKFYWNTQTKANYKVTAYNVNTNKILWQTKEFKIDEDNSGSPRGTNFEVYNNTFIVGLGNTSIYAYDINTGEVKWKTKLKLLGKSVLHNGLITVISNIGDMTQIDAKTGVILRESNIGFAELFNISLHKGIMYFATVTNKLMAIDATTHEKLWEMPPLNKCGYCTYGYAYTIVDAETNRLFVSDKKEVVCFLLK